MPLQLGMIARVRALSQGRSCLIRQILVTTTLDRYLSHVQSDQAQYIRANRCPFADVDLTSAHRPEREGRSHPSVRNDLIIYPERTDPALSLPGLSPAGPSRPQSWRVSRNTGTCRAVLAWCSPRVGCLATSLGHSCARAVSSSSRARTGNVCAPSSARITGWALRL